MGLLWCLRMLVLGPANTNEATEPHSDDLSPPRRELYLNIPSSTGVKLFRSMTLPSSSANFNIMDSTSACTMAPLTPVRYPLQVAPSQPTVRLMS